MRSYHFKLLVCGQDSFKAIREMLPELAWEPGMQRGFLMADDCTAGRLKGRYIYTKFAKQKRLDPDTLQQVEETAESLAECRFDLDLTKGLVSVEDRRGELNALYEALDSIPGAHIDFEDFNLNLKDYLFELQSTFKKNEVKNLRIRDYLAREHMIGNATFKLLEKQDAERLVERFADQLDAVSVAFKLPDGACNLGLTRKGALRFSDDAPEELIMLTRELLPQFHEAEVETAEAVNPAAARRKRK